MALIKALADQHAANVLPVIREIRRAGASSLHQIADALNARGITTPRGGQCTRHQCGTCWRGSNDTYVRSRRSGLGSAARLAGIEHRARSADRCRYHCANTWGLKSIRSANPCRRCFGQHYAALGVGTTKQRGCPSHRILVDGLSSIRTVSHAVPSMPLAAIPIFRG